MEKHLLVACGDAYHTSQSLRFTYQFFARREDLKLTLYYVAPRQESWHVDPVSLEACPEAAVGIARDKTERGRPMMDEAREWLLSMGFAPEQVAVKISQGKLGTVKEIVRESEEGLYDAAVLGRRGLSWFEEMVADSISHRILWESLSFPIWVCRNPEKGRKNVLLCVDGADECLRVADHVGYMLRQEPEHSVTLLHVCQDASCLDAETMFAKASLELAENGIEPERMHFKVLTSRNPAKTILAEAAKEKFAAVAIGRGSHKPSALDSLFATTSLKVMRGIEGAALWLCK